MSAATHTPTSRFAQLEKLGNSTFDVLVLGGGISGIAAAHEFTRRGYRCALIDNHDFASGTSQESSQLIWGGIKYLESGHAKLVSDLCLDRNRLTEEYARRVEPLSFLYPHFRHDKHALPILLAGAWLYWAMGRGFGGTPRFHSSRGIVRQVPRLNPQGFHGGFNYFDARMIESDARLALDILFDAMAAGLTAANYVEFKSHQVNAAGLHEIEAEDLQKKASLTVRARWIVNCTGVWTDNVNEQLNVRPPYRHLFSKGIHLIIPKVETSGHALTCLSKDGRVFFVIPWGEVTLIGTTDTPFDQPAGRVTADASDIEYLRSECERKFGLQLSDRDILNTKAGLRPLLKPANLKNEDFLSLARSHKVWRSREKRITAVWGGKYTSCFSMGREIADTIEITPPLHDRHYLPAHSANQTAILREAFMEMSGPERLAEACQRELVVTPEDFLRRRTNIALQVPNQGRGWDNEHAPLINRLESILNRGS